jgi:outer membrane protein assembly factor BamA
VFAGGITGQAPLFERFTLGDSTTLRGWNKFELAPIGGNRVFHQSIEYRLHGAALFLDAGSVWDNGGTRQLRASTGFGFHTDHVFLTVAFPLNAPGAGATFLMGVRF